MTPVPLPPTPPPPPPAVAVSPATIVLVEENTGDDKVSVPPMLRPRIRMSGEARKDGDIDLKLISRLREVGAGEDVAWASGGGQVKTSPPPVINPARVGITGVDENVARAWVESLEGEVSWEVGDTGIPVELPESLELLLVMPLKQTLPMAMILVEYRRERVMVVINIVNAVIIAIVTMA